MCQALIPTWWLECVKLSFQPLRVEGVKLSFPHCRHTAPAAYVVYLGSFRHVWFLIHF